MAYNTDKIANGLMENYKTIFSPLQYKKVNILEIGILEGASLHYWNDYFKHPASVILGIDLNLPQVEFGNRVQTFACNQNDSERLVSIAEKYGPFDIIIDDGSHFRKETENCFSSPLTVCYRGRLLCYRRLGGWLLAGSAALWRYG